MFCPKKEIMRFSLSFMIIGEGLQRLFFDVSKCLEVIQFNPCSFSLLERVKKNRMDLYIFVTGEVIETMVCGQVCCQGTREK
jgi:hypothetical protein